MGKQKYIIELWLNDSTYIQKIVSVENKEEASIVLENIKNHCVKYGGTISCTDIRLFNVV